tara:strand:+ start:196 stop:951 length:756 start_codon:yes stop_codon:yes gene_type:complete
MKRAIGRGFGKLTLGLWRDLADMVRFVETNQEAIGRKLLPNKRKRLPKVRVITAKITEFDADPRGKHGASPMGGYGLIKRWVYGWQQVVPKVDADGNFSFIVPGTDSSYTDADTRTALYGSLTGELGMGAAVNLMEQNNRETGQSFSPGGDAVRAGQWGKVAPGYPPKNSLSEPGNYLLPEDWSIQPISVNTIVIMYLVRTNARLEMDLSSISTADNTGKASVNVVPCFQLTNAFGRSHYDGGSRGTTCAS